MGRLVRVVLGLTLIFLVSQMAVITRAKAMQGTDGNDDLFTAYAEIMPGKSAATLPGRCASYVQQYQGSMTHICQLKPSDGDFGSGVVYVEQGVIDSIGFSMKSLEVGDLVKRWGRPQIEDRGPHGYNLYWEIGVYEVTVPVRGVSQFSYWSPVDFLAVSQGQ